MKKETKVNCEVETCKHNESKYCDLEELEISCTCDNENCSDKKETICNNFEKYEEDDDTCEEVEYEDLDKEEKEKEDIEDEELEEDVIENNKNNYIELEEDF